MDSIKMLQLEVTEGNLSVVAAAKHVMPEEVRNQPELRLPVAMDAVKQMLRNGQFSGRHLITSLPRDIVHVKNLRLPPMPPSDLEAAVEFESRNIFPEDINDPCVRFLPTGEVRQGSETRLEVICLAAQQREINTFVEQLHRTGCIIDSLDFEPSALYRGVERFIRRREDENEVHVLVDIGSRLSQVIIGKGRDISFFKPIDIGSSQLQQDVSRKLGITIEEARALRRRIVESGPACDGEDNSDSVRQAVHDATRSTIEELAREISLCLRYYSVTFRGHRPGKVRLLGGEGGDAKLLATMNSVLPIPVEAGRPLISVNTARMKQSERRGFMGEWAVAFGLGLKSTRGYFGARDGRQREPGAPRNETAEVIDLEKAVDGAAKSHAQESVHA